MTRARSIAAIVVAAGKGERASANGETEPKQYRLVHGIPVLTRTIRALLDIPEISAVVPVIHPDHAARYAALDLADDRLLPPVTGGATRQSSVLAGLMALGKIRPDLVLIQDAARPFVDAKLVHGVIAGLADHEAALPAMPVTEPWVNWSW